VVTATDSEISVLTGITNNFTAALLTRFFLGFIEAAFLPVSAIWLAVKSL
jgi:hypothetical protein